MKAIGVLFFFLCTVALSAAGGGFNTRSYGIEVWELTPVTNAVARSVLDEKPDVPFRMGGERRGFGCGLRTSHAFPVTEGAEYTLAFEGRADEPGVSYVVYARAFDEAGRDITALTEPPGGAWWRYSPSSGCFFVLDVTLSTTGAWQRVERLLCPPQGARAMSLEVSAWKGRNLACRRLLVSERPRYVKRRLEPTQDAVKVDVSESQKGIGAVAVRVRVSDLSQPHRPRALQVVLDWRSDLRGCLWHRDWRTDFPIADNSRYALGESMEGVPVSSYPFTAVSKGDDGFALATPFDAAIFEHRVVTAAGIRSTVALGLLERGADRRGTSAEFEWLLLPFRGTWGFRSAARAYHNVERLKFQPPPKGEKEGAWLFATLPSRLPDNPEDFGLTFWEAPETVVRDYPEELERAKALGIQVFAYTEAWGMRQKIQKGNDGRFPTETALLNAVRSWAADRQGKSIWYSAPCAEAAQALLNSLPVTPLGTHPHSTDCYSTWAAWWSTNPDPRLTKPNRHSLCWERRVGHGIEHLDGLYLDSLAYLGVLAYNNVRSEHLAVMDEPLIYDGKTAVPCANGMQHVVAFVRCLADRLHPAHQRLFANTGGIAMRFLADRLDVFGSETGSWGASDAVRRACNVLSDDQVCQRRFYAWHRPLVSLLQEGHWLRTPPEFSAQGMTNFVNHQIFYGMYPGVSTIGGDEKPGYDTWRRYFGPLRRCERDRMLFKKAIPLVRELNRVGWQPETGVRADAKSVWIERYGTVGKDKAYLTVRNVSDVAVNATLSPEFAVSDLVPLWGAGRKPVQEDEAWRVTLKPWETAAYEIVIEYHH